MMEKIANMKRPFVNLLHITLVCDKCMKSGVGKSCQHMLGDQIKIFIFFLIIKILYQGNKTNFFKIKNENANLVSNIPWWHDDQRHSEISFWMGGDESDTSYLAEVKGLPTERNIKAIYDQELCKRMKNEKSNYPKLKYEKFIFLAIDPAAGGTKSQFTVVSAFAGGPNKDKIVIIGADAIVSKNAYEHYHTVVNHIKKIRSLEEFSLSKFVVIPENNLGNEAFHIMNHIRQEIPDAIDFFGYDDGGGYKNGLRMDEHLKESFSRFLYMALYESRVVYYSSFFTITPEKTPETMKNLFYDQLVSYSRIVHPPKGDSNKITVTFSGKQGLGYDDLGQYYNIFFPY